MNHLDKANRLRTFHGALEMQFILHRVLGFGISGLMLFVSYKIQKKTGPQNRPKWLPCTRMVVVTSLPAGHLAAAMDALQQEIAQS